MRASFSIVNVVSTRLKLILRRRTRSGFFSSTSSALPSSSFLKEEVFLLEDSTSLDDLLPNPECIWGESAECNVLVSEFVDKYSSIYEHENSENDELKRIKSVLRNCGWNIGSETGYKIDLDQHNVIRILNDLFLESSDAAVALYFFRWSENCIGLKHTSRSICTMIHILIAGNMNYRAMELIQYLVRSNKREVSWHNLLLRVFFETHTERRILVTAYSMLVDCCVKEDMVNVAFQLTCQMKHLNIFPSLRVCNSLLRALLRSEQSKLAWDFLEEMQNQGIVLTASIISLFIHKYCSEGNLGMGLTLLMEMKNLGINPDIVSYSIVIDSLCKICHLKEATSMLLKLTQIGISLDSVSVSSLIDGYCKVGKFEKAICLLKVLSIPPNIYIYNSLLSKLCTDSNMAAAADVFQEIFELGLHPDSFSYTTIIGGYCKNGEIKKAFNFLGKMLKRGINESVATYTMLMNGYCKSGDLGMAAHLFQKMLTEGLVPDIVAYNTLMDGYGKKGHLHKAFELLDRMRSAGVSPDIVTYNTIIHSLILRGFVNEAMDILDELIGRGFSPDVVTFTNIVGAFSNKGNFKEAFLLWYYMSEHGMKPDVVACSGLLNGYCRLHRMEEANALFCEMLDIGLVPDLILYNTLIHGFSSVGSIDDACRLVNMMVERGVIPNEVTYRALVLGYEKKWVKNPVEAAGFKLRQILQKHGTLHIKETAVKSLCQFKNLPSLCFGKPEFRASEELLEEYFQTDDDLEDSTGSESDEDDSENSDTVAMESDYDTGFYSMLNRNILQSWRG
ncbi:pentatricopeptide repeat (PPR) superfamily protein [Actinidia rufa]|uniref:Pentatricopeptide repeat (PPR) superfamily protein n=1 Tax=Actinidia rufa TaxID=165716 RepID=A0A7J0GKK3_9ERIC|nr:pentatricopeptide repeat (PPR) superfamily protein [Actinidia rufa]